MMEEKKKQRLAYMWALLTIAATCIIGGLVANGSAHILPVLLGVSAVLFGPITGVLYLIEIKRGVFRVDDEEK